MNNTEKLLLANIKKILIEQGQSCVINEDGNHCFECDGCVIGKVLKLYK